jgi:hypothetical protein
VSQGTWDLPATNLSPLQLEMARYYNSQNPPLTVDVLNWWKEHEREYPLMSKAAKKILCIQPTSCSSERTFSTGGKTVTQYRTKLDSENVHMIVYCKENMPKLTIKKWKFTDPEEEDAEEEMDLEEATEQIVHK